MELYRKNEVRSRTNYCRGEAVNITYCECVFVDFGIQHALRMFQVIICDLSGCSKFFHIIS